jgi:hypothetical protein
MHMNKEFLRIIKILFFIIILQLLIKYIFAKKSNTIWNLHHELLHAGFLLFWIVFIWAVIDFIKSNI